jgi:hypothetical protein
MLWAGISNNYASLKVAVAFVDDDDDEMTCHLSVDSRHLFLNSCKNKWLKTGMENAYGRLSLLNG